MSQSIYFFQFDDRSVQTTWQRCINEKFSITSTQVVDGLSDIIRQLKSGGVQSLEETFFEMDDLIVQQFSHRQYNEYASDIHTALSFWLKVQVSKDFERDFDYDVEHIDAETWQTLFAQPKKLSEVIALKQSDQTFYEADLPPEDLLDIYLRIREVHDYSRFTETQMVALPEDVRASVRWVHRQDTLMARALPVIRHLAPIQSIDPARYASNSAPVPSESSLYLQDMDFNQILNHLDELLAKGCVINDIVSRLSDIHVIANYDLLKQKGATNIDLVRIRDTVSPIVIYNNLDVFKKANVPVELSKVISELDDDDIADLNFDVRKLLIEGVDPQIIADKCMSVDAVVDFVQLSLPVLLEAGARVDGNDLVNKLLKDDYLLEDFSDEVDIPTLRRAGANEEAIRKLQKFLDEHTVYGNLPPGEMRNINIEGRQSHKIFFQPIIKIARNDDVQELPTAWAGRILPGQTIAEGIATELKEVYGYEGRFEWGGISFQDYAKDRTGEDIERYRVNVTLFPVEGDRLPT